MQRQAFEYYRYGTVNFLVALEVATGRMYGWCLAPNDSASLCEALPALFRHYCRAKRLHLIWGNGASHIATDTQDFLSQFGPAVRPLFTPAHVS